MHLLLSGTPRLQLPDGSLQPLAPMDGALLTWLALDGATTRARMAGLLWPDSTPEAARNSLRQRLFKLKQQMGDGLEAGRDRVALGPGASHDLGDADGVLEGVEGLPGGPFAQWLAQQRERRLQRMRQSLAELATMAEAARDWDDALAHARELLLLDTLSEEAHRRVIRLHYLAGDRAAAMLAFDSCERLLKDEVGVRPDAQTLELLRLVEQGQPATAPDGRPALAGAALQRPPAVVGRDPVLATLQSAWQAGRPLLVLGEPGIGKTRLLESLVERWAGALLVRARPGDAGVPLALLGRLIEALHRQSPAARHWPGSAALQALLGGADPAAASHGPRSPAVPLAELLAAAAAQAQAPAFVLDDWQFADSASVELLTPLIIAPAALRLAVASRSGAGAQADARIAALQRDGACTVVSLGPLAAADIATLVADLVPQATDPRPLAAALAQRIGGNPLYVLEALRQLADSGLPPEAQHVAAPLQVKSLVAERLAQLPGPARQLLQLAAVAGGDFCVELAEAVTGRSALELAEAWALLERQGFFGSHGAAHDVHAEVAAEQLPQPIARVLHARVAGWLEGRSRQPATAPARVAGHWQAAGERRRASPHWAAAARLAWHASRPEEAFEFFSQAAAWHLDQGELDAAFDLWFDCADAMAEVGTPALGARCLAAMERLARGERQHLRLRLQRALLSFMRGDGTTLDADAAAMLAEAQALDDVRVEAECRFALARSATANGRFDEARQHLAACEARLLAAGDARRALAIAATSSLLDGLRGHPRDAVRAQQRMLPSLALQQDTATGLVLRSSLAQQWLRLGEMDEALAEATRVREALIAASVGPGDTLVILRNLLETWRWAGHFAEALALDEAVGARLATQGDYPGAQRNTAALQLALGRADLALPLLHARHEPDARLQRERLRWLLLRAQLALSTGKAATWPESALDQQDLPLAAEWALWSGLMNVSPWPVEALAGVQVRCHDAGLRLFAEPLATRLAWRQGQPPPRVQAVGATLPWAALFAARAWRLQGDAAAAACVAAEALAWLREVAQARLPPPFRDSFLLRHPAHRALRESTGGAT